jgi:hypothetical protein
MRSLLVIGLVITCGCDYTVFATQAGEHVVYHWDVATWAAEDERLCGGTAAAADQLFVAISTHYGWSLPDKGPTVEYFWDRQLTRSSCSVDASECVDGGQVVFAYQPFATHELAHTAQGGHGHLSFIDEGFATRWESGMVDLGPTDLTSATFFSEAQLRAQLELGNPQPIDQIDYQRGMTWLVALEMAFGPAKVGEFIDQLRWSSSPDDVERALQKVFGISLAESAALAESLPEGTVDDPVCEFANLPTWVLTDDPGHSVYVDRGEAQCGDDDLVSIHSQRAIWLFAIELPESGIGLNVDVSLPDGVNLYRQAMTLAMCNGKVDVDWLPFMIFQPGYGSETVLLHGRHVGALIGEIAADGSVELPRVSFEVVPHD